MAESWSTHPSATRRQSRAIESMTPGSLNGKVRQAKPAPDRVSPLTEPEEFAVHVAPSDDPPTQTYTGRLWFKTDEPVPE